MEHFEINTKFCCQKEDLSFRLFSNLDRFAFLVEATISHAIASEEKIFKRNNIKFTS